MTEQEQRIAIAEKRYEAFMLRVNVRPGNACWNWAGSRSGSGYGQFWDGNRIIPAHWFLLQNYPQKGKEACHKCDNKLCVRPSHIFIGTRSDNVRDCVLKGRLRPKNGCLAMLKVRLIHRGIHNHECKLTNEQALIAKACPLRRGAATALAKQFGVSLSVICGIRKGKRWSHLPKPTATAAQRAEALLRTIGKWKD